MCKILSRIQEISDKEEISITALEKKIGASKGVLSRALAKGTDIQAKWIEALVENYPQYSTDWLLTGHGPMLKCDPVESSHDDLPTNFNIVPNTSQVDAKAIPFATANKQGLKPIPLVTQQVAAGFGNADFSISEEDVKAYYVIPRFRFLNVDFMIEVTGVSMMPKYNPGDIVACTIIRSSRFIQWNRPHVIALTEQGLVIKRIRQAATEDSLTFVSDNNDYAPFDVPKDDIAGIALVVGHVGLD